MTRSLKLKMMVMHPGRILGAISPWPGFGRASRLRGIRPQRRGGPEGSSPMIEYKALS